MNIILLDNLFSGEWKAKGREDLIQILGRSMEDWLTESLSTEDIKVSKLEDFHISDSDELLIFNVGACTASPKDLAEFALSSSNRLLDKKGLTFAVKVQSAILASLMEEKENIFFEDLIQKLENDPSSNFSDKDEEAMVIEGPLVHSFPSLVQAEKKMSQLIAEKWMSRGVRIDHPELLSIGPDVSIGEGSWISGSCRISGQTVIGKNCRITDRSEIVDSTIADNVTIRSSLIESSQMDEGSNIGPFSHLRPGAVIGKNCHIGNFVEVKKSVLGPGTKAGHLAYIGDAELGEGINVSCGVIFCNYDGKNKHRSKVGAHSFLGSNANLVAPVVIEEDSFIAAGSTITKDVQKGSLAVERAEQKNVEGYVERKKKKGQL